MRKTFIPIAGFILVLATGCQSRYMPDIVTNAPDYLVVEGLLNTGEGGTRIRLSRTTKVDRGNNIIGDASATVSVEGRDNSSVMLAHQGSGIYTHPDLGLIIGNEYRIRIHTNDGKEYLSAYVMAKLTPAIDSITWKRTPDLGVGLFINSHDNTNNTWYYRWEYDETWEIHSFYYSKYIFENNIVRPRVFPEEDVSVCWRHVASTSILLGTTAKLTSDVISQIPVLNFRFGDERLSVRYSLLVRQYALDKAAFEYYDLLKKNTESIGTVFDPMPSEVKGNIFCMTNPAEPVLGFISASDVQEKRIFISASEVPGWRFYQDCDSTTVSYQEAAKFFEITWNKPYGDWIDPVTNDRLGYLAGYDFCVDCTLRKGVTTRPSFW
ncbi:MAG: DUF4249 domain-containing protein [Chitinophagaceae bacterium]